MKRMVAMLITLNVVIALSGCTSEEPLNTKQVIENTTATSSVVETSELPTTEPPTTVAPTTEPRYVQIDITMDNWEEYFSIEFVDSWYKNEFDEIDRVIVGYHLNLKDEYLERFDPQKTSITIKCHSKKVYYHCNIDYSAMKYELGEIEPDRLYPDIENIYTVSGDCFNDNDFNRLDAGGVNAPDSVISIPEKFEVLNIKGSLSLKE